MGLTLSFLMSLCFAEKHEGLKEVQERDAKTREALGT